MSKRQILALLGIWVMVFPWLNFPPAWKPWIMVVTGLLIILVAYRRVAKKNIPASNSSYVENAPTSAPESIKN